MEILFLLVPMSVVLALAVIGVFAWALQAGQFDAIEAEGRRILDDDDIGDVAARSLDADQGPAAAGAEQSPGTPDGPSR